MIDSTPQRIARATLMVMFTVTMGACATAQTSAQPDPIAKTEVSRSITQGEVSQTGRATTRSSIDRWNLEARDPAELWPEATTAEPEEYYRVEARLLGDTVQLGGEGLHPAARGRLLTSSVTQDGLQAKSVTGRAGLSVSLPLETAAWLAVLDLYRNRAKEPAEVVHKRGLGKHSHALQSQSKDMDGGSESQTLAVMREVSGFRVSPDIECSAQVKIYGEQVVGSSAAQRARDHVDRTDTEAVPEWKQRQRLGLEARGRGQVVTRHFSTRRDGTLEYELQIHMSIEVDNDGGTSELRERAMQCRSSKPIFARELSGYWIEAREQEGYWAVSVQASESSKTTE
jgi:hypothetical protein